MSAWVQALEADLKWREDEIAALKHQVAQHRKGSLPYRALLRALWAMLYAHYEGFCKTAITVYLDELKRKNVTRGHCREDFVIFSLGREFRTMKTNASAAECYIFFQRTMPTLLAACLECEIDPTTGEYRLQGRSNL